MPDRHFELPAHPDLEYYRKQAKHLQRMYEAGDAAAQARVADLLGDRAAGRFLLSDAQFVLAQEHGFRTWAEFRAHIQNQTTTTTTTTTTGDRPVSRLVGTGPGGYASMADALLTDLRRNDPGALQRLRAYVPRYAAATDAAAAGLRDARLIIARELGFPTWRELVSFAEKSVRDLDERQEKFRRLRPQAEALLAADTGRLARLTAGQADTLLHMLAIGIPGARPGRELGVPRAGVDVLIGKATNLDLPLTWAAIRNRVEYVRLLLGAGADPGTRTGGTTPLENAIYFGNTQVVDLLAGHGIVPQALWTYAACGRLDLVRACFDADGTLRPDAAASRPNPANVGYLGFPPQIPPTSDPEEIIAEAFVHACQHGRTEVVRWFLDHGVRPDVKSYLGRTGLHWAILALAEESEEEVVPDGPLEVIRLLLQRGADPSIRDDLLHADADGWLHVYFATRMHDPVIQQIHDLIESRTR